VSTSNGARNGHRNGHPSGSGKAAVEDARPLLLVRYRPGVVADTARTVHLVALPRSTPPPGMALTACCGALLRPAQIETVTPGTGMPCTLCVVHRVAGSPPPDRTLAPTEQIIPGMPVDAAAATYQAWGWPVTLRANQVHLTLGRQAVALLVPVSLAAETAALLAARRCPPAVLAYPDAPEYRVLLAGQPFGVPLGWPEDVRRITATVLLPPSITPHGPVSWLHPPHPQVLTLTREIDLAAALYTTQLTPPHGEGEQPPPG
jgi:hypothetical protein